jgi:hypothetical protein
MEFHAQGKTQGVYGGRGRSWRLQLPGSQLTWSGWCSGRWDEVCVHVNE